MLYLCTIKLKQKTHKVLATNGYNVLVGTINEEGDKLLIIKED